MKRLEDACHTHSYSDRRFASIECINYVFMHILAFACVKHPQQICIFFFFSILFAIFKIPSRLFAQSAHVQSDTARQMRASERALALAFGSNWAVQCASYDHILTRALNALAFTAMPFCVAAEQQESCHFYVIDDDD